MSEEAVDDDQGDDDGVASFTDDSPHTTKLLVAEKIDSASEGGKTGEEVSTPGEIDEALLNEEEEEAVAESRSDQVLDSGFNDLSSTAATTPDEPNIFSPQPAKPAG